MRQSLALVVIALFAAGCARAAAFSANVAIISNHKQFTAAGQFAGSAGIDPPTQAVTFRVGAFSVTIPAGSFQLDPSSGRYVFVGNINGAQLAGSIWSQGGDLVRFGFTGRDAEGLPTANPVDVHVAIGSYSGDASVTVRYQ